MDDQPAQPIPPSLTHIFDLPEEPIVNILTRLDSDHLARSRVVSKAFSDISTKVRSVNLLCSLDRYTNSRQPITPFKEIVTDLILRMGGVDSISIGVEERANHKSLDVKLDDLYLTEVSFVYRWLKRVCGGLASLSISDYRMHSRRKWSEVLSLISFHCKNLHELVLKNAWLSTKGLSSAMLKLTSLTLAFVRLDDEGLYNLNSCCPSLQILNLIMVEGLKNSEIVNLLHLRTSQFVGSSSAPTAQLPLIHAPNLTRFEVGFGLRIDKIVRCELDLGAEVFHCNNLHELVLKNAWLATKGLSSPMLMLTSLTLECVRLDDEDLHKVNSCCPSLQILNLIMVEGLEGPRIDLLHLRSCQFVGSSGLPLIHAPNLTRFEVGLGMRIDKIVRRELDLSSVNFLAPVSPVSILNMLSERWLKDLEVKDVKGLLKDLRKDVQWRLKDVQWLQGWLKDVPGWLKDVQWLQGWLKDVQELLKNLKWWLKDVKWLLKDELLKYLKWQLKDVKWLLKDVKRLLKEVKWLINCVEGLINCVEGRLKDVKASAKRCPKGAPLCHT